MSYINGEREQQNRNITLQLGLGLAAINDTLLLRKFLYMMD